MLNHPEEELAFEHNTLRIRVIRVIRGLPFHNEIRGSPPLEFPRVVPAIPGPDDCPYPWIASPGPGFRRGKSQPDQ